MPSLYLFRLPSPYRVFPRATIRYTPAVVVTSYGRLCVYITRGSNLRISLAGQVIGVKEVEDGIWRSVFMNYDLGKIDLEEKTLRPIEKPFGTIV